MQEHTPSPAAHSSQIYLADHIESEDRLAGLNPSADGFATRALAAFPELDHARDSVTHWGASFERIAGNGSHPLLSETLRSLQLVNWLVFERDSPCPCPGLNITAKQATDLRRMLDLQVKESAEAAHYYFVVKFLREDSTALTSCIKALGQTRRHHYDQVFRDELCSPGFQRVSKGFAGMSQEWKRFIGQAAALDFDLLGLARAERPFQSLAELRPVLQACFSGMPLDSKPKQMNFFLFCKTCELAVGKIDRSAAFISDLSAVDDGALRSSIPAIRKLAHTSLDQIATRQAYDYMVRRYAADVGIELRRNGHSDCIVELEPRALLKLGLMSGAKDSPSFQDVVIAFKQIENRHKQPLIDALNSDVARQKGEVKQVVSFEGAANFLRSGENRLAERINILAESVGQAIGNVEGNGTVKINIGQTPAIVEAPKDPTLRPSGETAPSIVIKPVGRDVALGLLDRCGYSQVPGTIINSGQGLFRSDKGLAVISILTVVEASDGSYQPHILKRWSNKALEGQQVRVLPCRFAVAIGKENVIVGEQPT